MVPAESCGLAFAGVAPASLSVSNPQSDALSAVKMVPARCRTAPVEAMPAANGTMPAEAALATGCTMPAEAALAAGCTVPVETASAAGFAASVTGLARHGQQEEPVQGQPSPCPWCRGSRVIRHGGFRMASGRRVQRYLCKSCGRTFSPNTGTPAYRIRKQESWREMVELLTENLPLRQVGKRLGISVSTAFHWRHRALAVLNAQPRGVLTGDVRVEVFLVKYSEKGSRICNGPGSWGYWNIVRRGPAPDGRSLPRPARAGRNRFRLLIDGRPLNVMVAETDSGYELGILGQGRRTPELVGPGLAQMVMPGSRVFAFGGNEYRSACETMGYEYHDGYAAVSGRSEHAASGSQGEVVGEEESPAGRVRVPNLPTWWLRRFRGVATRYLNHYLAWFRDIVRIVQYPDGHRLAPVDGRALLRTPAR